MELSRLRKGEILAAAAGIALLLVMYLDWYSVGGTQGVRAEGVNAYDAFHVSDYLLIGVAAVAVGLAVLTATQHSPALPVAASVITSAVGIIATLLVLSRIINQPGPNDFIEPKLGAFLGFACVLGIATGGLLSLRDEGTSAEDLGPATPQPAPPAEGPSQAVAPPEEPSRSVPPPEEPSRSVSPPEEPSRSVPPPEAPGQSVPPPGA